MHHICITGVITDVDNFFVWNFEMEDSQDMKRPSISTTMKEAIPTYLRVREIRVNKKDDKFFLDCSCGFYHRVGLPCGHVFFLVDSMNELMFHVRYWKAYHAHWGADTPLGNSLMSAQTQHFKYEGLGVQITIEDYKKLASQWESKQKNDNFPIFLGSTTDQDYSDAMFVRGKLCCLKSHLQSFRDGESIEDKKMPTIEEQMNESETHISSKANTLQQRVLASTKNDVLASTVERDDIRKKAIGCVDEVLNCDRFSLQEKQAFVEQLRELKNRMFATKTETTREELNATYEFAGEECLKGPIEVRKKNALDN